MRKRKRQSSPSSISKDCDNATNTYGDTSSANPTDIQDTQAEPQAQSQSEFESHFSANINRGWQKLDDYYQKTDSTPIYRAAVLLHPRMKWAWFEYRWSSKPAWIDDARKAIQELWNEYKDKPTVSTSIATSPSGSIEPEEWFTTAPQEPLDQMELYLREGQPPTISSIDSPIPYWISKASIWPQLAQLALDVFSTPAMSDEPERVFSMAGNTLSPRRRRLNGDTVQEVLCLRSWQAAGLIQFDASTFEKAVAVGDGMPIDDDLEYNASVDLNNDEDSI
jgi:hypothetical protein